MFFFVVVGFVVVVFSLTSHNHPQVIPLSKLQTNYKTFESKRQLSSIYDLYLTDKRLYHLLPRQLGKKFFEKKKFVNAFEYTASMQCVRALWYGFVARVISCTLYQFCWSKMAY